MGLIFQPFAHVVEIAPPEAIGESSRSRYRSAARRPRSCRSAGPDCAASTRTRTNRTLQCASFRRRRSGRRLPPGACPCQNPHGRRRRPIDGAGRRARRRATAARRGRPVSIPRRDSLRRHARIADTPGPIAFRVHVQRGEPQDEFQRVRVSSVAQQAQPVGKIVRAGYQLPIFP